MGRSLVVIGNWKMHKTQKEAKEFIQALLQKVSPGTVKVGLAVPFTSLNVASEVSKNKFLIGSQNISPFSKGAYTGEISCSMIQEAGGVFTLAGHSERRGYYHEEDAFINKKVLHALSEGMQVILCIGETEQQHFLGETESVLKDQLKKGLKEVSSEGMSKVIIAYEPVWAIGTGKSATAEEAEEVHHFCRLFLQEIYGKEVAACTSILYGGSVTEKNIQELLNKPNIDGALVGGASLDVDSFATIVNFAKDVDL